MQGKNRIISLSDGYIEIDPRGFFTWSGVEANKIKSIYNKTLRASGLEDTNQALNEFIDRVIL